jgi:glutathione S-transferase
MKVAPKIKYYYFDVFGRGELARIILHYNKVDFEDVRLGWAEWAEMKQQGKHDFAPCAQLPVLEYDGFKLSQSYVIGRYLCIKFGQYPADTDLQAWIEEIKDYVNVDINEDYVEMFYLKDEEKKKEFLDTFFDDRLAKKYQYLNNFVKRNGCNGFMVGKQMSLADFTMLELGNRLLFNPTWEGRCKQYLEKYPELVEYYKIRHEDAGWKEYLARRKDSSFNGL